jgi:hypothetical protein
MTRKQVENLLDTSYRLRAVASGYNTAAQGTDVIIEIEKHDDGTLLVLPSRAS